MRAVPSIRDFHVKHTSAIPPRPLSFPPAGPLGGLTRGTSSRAAFAPGGHQDPREKLPGYASLKGRRLGVYDPLRPVDGQKSFQIGTFSHEDGESMSGRPLRKSVEEGHLIGNDPDRRYAGRLAHAEGKERCEKEGCPHETGGGASHGSGE